MPGLISWAEYCRRSGDKGLHHVVLQISCCPGTLEPELHPPPSLLPPSPIQELMRVSVEELMRMTPGDRLSCPLNASHLGWGSQMGFFGHVVTGPEVSGLSNGPIRWCSACMAPYSVAPLEFQGGLKRHYMERHMAELTTRLEILFFFHDLDWPTLSDVQSHGGARYLLLKKRGRAARSLPHTP